MLLVGAATALAHVVVLLVVEVHTPAPVDPEVLAARAERAARMNVDLACAIDMGLVAGARLMACPLPTTGDPRACAAFASRRFAIDAVQCRAPEDVAALDIALITPAPLVDDDAVELAALDLQEQQEEEIAELVEEARAEEEDPNVSGQVVDMPKPAVEVRPDDADYVSEYDSKVEKETVARGDGSGQPATPPPQPAIVAPPAPRDPTPPEPAIDDSADDTAPEADDPVTNPEPKGGGMLAMRTTTEGTAAERDGERGDRSGEREPVEGGAVPREGDPEAGGRGERGAGSSDGTDDQQAEGEGEGDGDGERTEPRRPRYVPVRPTEEIVSRATGGSNDYLPDVDEGNETLLNSKRWRYAPFFNRVKRQVAQNWHPDKAYRLRDPTGNIYGHKNRLTVLHVSLKPDGSLARVVISQPSGVDFLDDEAMRAFQMAQPFPNPPGALVDRDSRLITFRFGFMFEINTKPRWKVFRYEN